MTRPRLQVLPLTAPAEGESVRPLPPAGGNQLLLELELLRGRILTAAALGEAERESWLGDVDRMRGRVLAALITTPPMHATLESQIAQPSDVLDSPNLVGNQPAVRSVLARATRIARTPYTVLITGETGTGKEVLARIIHEASGRRHFHPVNCGAIPQSLMESELFGHVRGAFTGATRDRPGMFEVADGGTIFLDEVGELDAAMQVRLLRVLQDGEVQRVGSDRPVRVDVRVVAATNRKVVAGSPGPFREDLFYRLAVCHLHLPPLRERRDEIASLLSLFLAQTARELGRPVPPLEPALERYLLDRCNYPGNIRQLENIARLIVALTDPGHVATLNDLHDAHGGELASALESRPSSEHDPIREQVAQLQRERVEDVLRRCHGNVRHSAAELGISVSRLYQLARKFELHPRSFDRRSL